VLQLLFTLPEVCAQYLDRYDALVRGRSPPDPAADVVTQTAKLAQGLGSERYAPAATLEEAQAVADTPEADHFTTSIEPRMFKTLVGRGHAEFSSGRQQDAAEYLQHLLDILLRCVCVRASVCIIMCVCCVARGVSCLSGHGRQAAGTPLGVRYNTHLAPCDQRPLTNI
jgi:uncharacterized UBP type Zn finger protein